MASDQVTSPGTRGDTVYEHLRARIAAGEIKGGENLTVRSISQELGVSFSPVSDAFRRLESEGLLITEPRRGTRVTEPSADRLREEVALRMAIEAEAMRRATRRAPDEVKAGLLELAGRVDTALGRDGQHDEAYRLDVEFHLTIAEASGVPRFSKLLEDVQLRLLLSMQADATHRRGHPLSDVTHVDLARAMLLGDENVASSLMRSHCGQSAARALGTDVDL